MTDPADRLGEEYLEGRLHALARGVSVPVVPALDDVRRGRRRLFRVRVAMAGGTTAALAVVLGVTGLTVGDPSARSVDPATPGRTTLPATPSTSPTAEATVPTGKQRGDETRLGSGASPGADLAVAGGPTGSPGRSGKGGGVADGDHTDASNEPGTDHATSSTQLEPTESADPTTDPTTGPTQEPTAPVDPTTPPVTEPPSTTPPTVPPTTPPPTTPPTTPPTDPGRVRVHATLRLYNNVLAEHLDADRDHLAPYNRKTGNRQTTLQAGELLALGSTYAWQDGKALAGLQVSVATGWDQVDWRCGSSTTDWDCHDVPLAPTATGPTSAEAATHDGVRQVAVQHADGQVVVLTADPTYDDSSRPVGSVGSDDEADLVAAASDARLTLPGQPPVSPPDLDVAAFAAAGQAALVLTKLGETFTQTSIDRSPEVSGDWADDELDRGTLTWSAAPVYSGNGWGCGTQFRSCTEVVVEGRTIHVGLVRPKAGGGVVIGYDGPSYAVRVLASDKKFPKKRAFAFVTADAWQPAR